MQKNKNKNRFVELLNEMGMYEVENYQNKFNKYPKTGQLFHCDNYYASGYYWINETDEYIFDIHDFITKDVDFVQNESQKFLDVMPITTSYVISGQWIVLDREKEEEIKKDGKFMVINLKNDKYRYILPKQTKVYCVSFSLKHKLVNDTILNKLKLTDDEVDEIFHTNEDVINEIEKIANQILNCKLEGASARLFFDAKAREWLSIYIENYYSKKIKKNISQEDNICLEKVIQYIANHYMVNIPHVVLEKIACMSSTSLKNKFKAKYHMNITEYIQRYRINIAENLIKNTNLDLKSIAESVGYKNHSRFTNLFKKYKLVYPKEVKKNR